MELEQGEQQLAEHTFKGANHPANYAILTKRTLLISSILTDRRLIVVYGANPRQGTREESYQLSQITGVEAVFKRSWWMLVIGVILLPVGFAAFKAGAGFLPTAALLGAAAGWIGMFIAGKTRMVINQVEGEKRYVVGGRELMLPEFVDEVNARVG